MSPNFIGLASGSSASYLQLAILMRQFNFRISFGKNDKTPRAKLPLWAGRSKQGRQWVGKFLHARGYECGTRALYYHHRNSIELLNGGMIFTLHQQQIECIHSQTPNGNTIENGTHVHELTKRKLHASGFTGHPRLSGHPGKFTIFKLIRIR